MNDAAVHDARLLDRDPVAVFRDRVQEFGGRVAVRSPRVQLTFAELDAASSGVARAVARRSGSGTEPVAIACREPTAAIAAMLGALKTGRPWLAIDPLLPHEHARAQIDDAGATLVVADSSQVAYGRETVAIDRIGDATTDDYVSDPPTDPDAAACILYTSGSTGRPKGVVRPRITLQHAAAVHARRFAVVPDDRFVLLTSLAHGSGVSNAFRALLAGASLHPFDLRDGGFAGLVEWLERERITVYQSVPSVFREFASRLARKDRTPHRHPLRGIRLVHLAGERMSRRDVSLFRKHFAPECRLVNNLGATEAPAFLQHVVDRHLPGSGAAADAHVPVGVPVEGYEVRVVDGAGREVPDGDVGQIAIRGRYVALGYWRQPERTREAFAAEPGSAMRTFLSGDLARKRADGVLEYLGRSDARLKLRGLSVDPAAADAAFAAVVRDDPALGDGVLVVRSRRDGSARLVAYVTPAPGRDVAVSALRDACRARLPQGFVPQRIIVVPQLPRRPDGTVDRDSLPAHEPRDRESTPRRARERPRHPRTTVELELTRVFGELLETERVGFDDGFFDLGGDSLLALSLLLEVERRFGVRLSTETLFASDTVHALAAHIAQGSDSEHDQSIEGLHVAGSRPPLFGVGGLGGSVLRIRSVGKALGPKQPFYGLHPPGMDWTASGRETLEEMAAHYVETIRRVQSTGPYHLLGASFGGKVAFEMALQLQAGGHEVALLALVDSSPPHDAANARSARAPELAAARGPEEHAPAWARRLIEFHQRASAAYRPGARFDGRILYFLCTGVRANEHGALRLLWQPRAALAHVGLRMRGDPRLRWPRFATRGVAVVHLPGVHGQFHREPQARRIARALRSTMESRAR